MKKNEQGETPLMVASRFNASPDAIRALLNAASVTKVHLKNGEYQDSAKQSPDVNAKSDSGNTALMYAARYNASSYYAVKLLLEAGADVNAKNKDGSSALLEAVLADSLNLDTLKATHRRESKP